MSGYKNIAVLGAGNQGKEIVEALLAAKAVSAPTLVVTVLTRPVRLSSLCDIEPPPYPTSPRNR
jgi:pyrroline-5-carboxylate reductase